jgi:hypothetical protein
VSFAGGTLSATGTGGTVTSVAALTLGTTGTDLSSTVTNGTTTPVITLNVPTASATNRGALSAADWSTFNGKAPAVTYTTNYIPYGQGTTTPNQSSALTFDGTNFATTGKATSAGLVMSYATGYFNVDSTLSSYASNNNVYLNGNAGGGLSLRGDGTGKQQVIVNGGASSTITFTTAGTVNATLNATGNLGVGVTPSTWTSYKAIELAAVGNSFYSISSEVGITSNANYNSGWKYSASSIAPTKYSGGSGIHTWSYAAAGTAGNALTWIQAMATNTAGGVQHLNTISVGNATPSTSGAGITFPATQSASTNANTLDDYEEGTWTPSVTAGSGTITTVGTVVGSYTKIGRQVTVSFSVAITTNGTGASYIQITGLPFAPNASPGTFCGCGFQNSTGKALSIGTAASTIYARLYDATYPASSGETLYGTITYNV